MEQSRQENFDPKESILSWIPGGRAELMAKMVANGIPMEEFNLTEFESYFNISHELVELATNDAPSIQSVFEQMTVLYFDAHSDDI